MRHESAATAALQREKTVFRTLSTKLSTGCVDKIGNFFCLPVLSVFAQVLHEVRVATHDIFITQTGRRRGPRPKYLSNNIIAAQH